MKLPAFQFYPGDWRKDPAVQSLDYAERGIWIELLCLMHESSQPGKLMIGGSPYPEDRLARLLGLSPEVMSKVISTLITLGVAARCPETGAVMSARMVRDRDSIKKRAEFGKRGGNPNFQKGKTNPYYQTDKPEDNHQNKGGDKYSHKQKITPSSSFSLSSSDDLPPIPPPPPAAADDCKDSRHYEITSQWGKLYAEAFGTTYVAKGRDFKTLQKFLTCCKDPSDAILTIAVRAWERMKQDRYAKHCKESTSIHGLCDRYSDVVAELKTPTQPSAKHTNLRHGRADLDGALMR